MCSVGRAGRSHTFGVYVDHDDCGAAEDITMAEADDVPEMMKIISVQGRDSGSELVTETLDGPEFRWQVEAALEARAVHDGELPDDAFDDPEDSQYPVLATLLRARVAQLPRSAKPLAPHADATTAVAPAPRRASGAPASIYQLKVGLRGAEPPIWRRLEVPAEERLEWMGLDDPADFDPAAFDITAVNRALGH